MACYLYSEIENQPAIPACNCHYAGQSCSFPILSSLPPDHHQPTRLLKCDKLRCANVLHYNTIVQCRIGYVVSLATPTKAEPLYKVHTHACSLGPCSQFYDRGCPHLEVILEYFCLFLFTHIFFSFIECLYQRFTVNKNNNNDDDNIDINSLSSSSDL